MIARPSSHTMPSKMFSLLLPVSFRYYNANLQENFKINRHHAFVSNENASVYHCLRQQWIGWYFLGSLVYCNIAILSLWYFRCCRVRQFQPLSVALIQVQPDVFVVARSDDKNIFQPRVSACSCRNFSHLKNEPTVTFSCILQNKASARFYFFYLYYVLTYDYNMHVYYLLICV